MTTFLPEAWPEGLKLDPDRPTVWYQPEIDGWGYRPSGLGSCIRALTACRLGDHGTLATPDEETVMEEGNVHEPHIAAATAKEWTRRMGFPCRVQRQYFVYMPVWMDCFLAGSADGIIWGRKKKVAWGFEAKAMGSSVFKDTEAEGISSVYSVQRSIYFWGLEHMLGRTLAGYVLAYKNRNNGQIRWHVIERPEHGWDWILKRIVQVESAAARAADVWAWGDRGNSLPPCGKDESYHCAWRHLHSYGLEAGGNDKQRAGLAELARGVKNLEADIAELGPTKEAKDKIRRLEEKRDELKDKIASLVTEEKFQCGRHRIEVKEGRGRWDLDAMKRRVLELEAQGMGIRTESVPETCVTKFFTPGNKQVKIIGPPDARRPKTLPE